MTERLARFWLSQGDLSSQTIRKILTHYQSARAFYENRAQAGPLLGGAWKWLQTCQEEAVLEAGLQRLQARGVTFLTDESPHWPSRLNHLEDPPIGLYCMGDTSLLLDEKIFAMVGTRHCTVYGKQLAQSISRDLSQSGAVILSGFAVGIDSVCHEACLESGGKTIALLGCGLDVEYPSGSQQMREKVVASGGLIATEHPMKSRPMAGHFPQRNRMIAALAKGLMLIEGTTRSGGMISAHLAMEMGAEVFALPGSIQCAQSSGPHQLIREGARLATCAQEILSDMGWQSAAKNEPQALNGPEAYLASLIEQEPLSFDQLTQLTGWPADELTACLTMMELSGVIQKSPGRVYSKAM